MPTLRLVVDNPRAPPRRPRQQGTDIAIILPEVKLPDREMYSTWLGMTERQADMAWRAACVGDGECTAASLQRVIDAHIELEATLTEHRGVLLAAMMTRYPRAARRLMKAAQQRH